MHVYIQGRYAHDKKTKIITALNFTGQSGPDFWYFPSCHRTLKSHTKNVQELINNKAYTTIVHLPIELSEEDKRVYSFVNDNFLFRGALLPKDGKLTRQFASKYNNY